MIGTVIVSMIVANAVAWLAWCFVIDGRPYITRLRRNRAPEGQASQTPEER